MSESKIEYVKALLSENARKIIFQRKIINFYWKIIKSANAYDLT